MNGFLRGAGLVVLLALVAVAPLTYPGFFEAHSGFLPSFNVQHIDEAPNWGRAADPLRGEGRLPYLATWPLWWLSGSGVAAVKWGYGLGFVLAALAVYGWTRRLLGTRGAVLAAVVYTYLPWHLATVYVRGAYAEAWLWVWLPLFLWAMDRLGSPRRLAAAVGGVLALAAALWTQAGLALLFLAIVAAGGAIAAGIRLWRGWAILAAAAGLAGLVALAALRAPLGEAFAGGLLYPFSLLSASWSTEAGSYQLGLAAVGLTVVSVALWLTGSKAAGDPPFSASHGRAAGLWLAVLLVSVALTLRPASGLWRVSGAPALVSYPWQALAVAGLPLAFLAGSVVRLDRRLAGLSAWAGLLALTVLASYPYLAPRFTQVDPGREPVALFRPGEKTVPGVMLLDAGVTPAAEITSTLAVTLTWQALAPVEQDYTVFVHLLAADGSKVTQHDARPCAGGCPTSGWQPGRIEVDVHPLSLPAGAAPGPYRLAVGLYNLDTGERVAVAGRDDATVVIDVR